jgi:anaerobic carbon-monoxide dehydrogenase iron sulfur subunit
MKKHMVINSKLCNGCKICTMACSLQKSGKFNQFHTGIWIESDDGTGHNDPQICRQCRNPVCVKACPAEKAWRGESLFESPIYRDEITGIVWLDSRKESCLGCKECMNACPFGSIRIIPDDLQLVKCDLCGGDPECVRFCPTGAVRFVEVTKTEERKSL